ncbi:Mu P family protein [Kaistia dalseonensis]|uniref:Prophage tail gpP-like protein n=1 Tax=Kaistia dalseonensis TaxID=410840 RepID=A0ABU0HCC6_9HYPH|nr:Mu P family protein [Kaistia dalseonensis]MCX5497331.1 Mu P family protein [Kaistia dalseonensis]MDQ0439968.1 prophage tail gpP-like protein [Kaistia dalseonensis]
MTSRPFITTRRIGLAFAGQVFNEWTRVEIPRSIDDISGSFTLELRDAPRPYASWPFATLAQLARQPQLWDAVTITLDGRPIMVGYVDRIEPDAAEGRSSVTVTGRDKTADLVDCAATVDGPAEYRNVTVLDAAKMICAPFGISVKADVDVGEPIDRVAIDPGETAMSAIEKLVRQRALIVTSDGVGGLLLTRSGRSRAPAALVFPGNVYESRGSFSAEGRYSDYVVKGQMEKAAGGRESKSQLDATAFPLATNAQPERVTKQAAREEAGVTINGRAKDEEVTRYRPIVSMGRTQLDAKSAQKQAEWMMRTTRGRSETIEHSVKGFGSGDAIWRPNTLAFVDDAYQGVNRDMLIAGVTLAFDEQGEATHLGLTGPEAYDTEPEGDRRKDHRRRTAASTKKTSAPKALDSTAHRLNE